MTDRTYSEVRDSAHARIALRYWPSHEAEAEAAFTRHRKAKSAEREEDYLILCKSCAKCGRFVANNEPDPCIGRLDGVLSACCGHGEQDGYVMFSGKLVLRGQFEGID